MALQFTSNNRATVISLGAPRNNNTININFNLSVALPSYATDDIFLHAGARDDYDGYLIFDTFGIGAQSHNADTHILGRIARGSRAAPSAVGVNIDLSPQVVSSGDSYLLVGAIPYGGTGYSATPTTFVVLQPAELQTDTAQGSRVRVGVTKSGTTTATGGRYFWTFNNDGQLEINVNEVAPPTFLLSSTSKVRVIGADNTAIFQSIEGYGASGIPGFNLSHALGTAAAPSLVTNNTVLGAYGFNGYGASGFTTATTSGAQMRAFATQTWSAGAEGSALEFWTTTNATATIAKKVKIDQDGALLSYGGGIGYTTGAGGTVTQGTSKSTGVTLNKICGEIATHNASLAAGASVFFTFTNSAIAATDLIVLNHVTSGTGGAYILSGGCGAGSAIINIQNNTGGALAEVLGIRFAVIKGITS